MTVGETEERRSGTRQRDAKESEGEARGDESNYARIEDYPWESDVEFQAGLQAILGPSPSVDQAVELSLRARCFYYSKKFNKNVDFDQYRAWRQITTSQLSSTAKTPQSTGISAGPGSSGGAGSVAADRVLPSSIAKKGQLFANENPIMAEAGNVDDSDNTNHANLEVDDDDADEANSVPFPSSFAKIINLIASGEPITGIKNIPETVLVGRGTKPTSEVRKKAMGGGEGARLNSQQNDWRLCEAV